MRDPNKARIMRALRALERKYPDARSWEVDIRDDGSLRRRVNDQEVKA